MLGIYRGHVRENFFDKNFPIISRQTSLRSSSAFGFVILLDNGNLLGLNGGKLQRHRKSIRNRTRHETRILYAFGIWRSVWFDDNRSLRSMSQTRDSFSFPHKYAVRLCALVFSRISRASLTQHYPTFSFNRHEESEEMNKRKKSFWGHLGNI